MLDYPLNNYMEQNNIQRITFKSNIDDFLYTEKDYEFAYVVLKMMSVYRFIIVYGPSGVGKSHLVKGLIGDYKAANPNKIVCETSAEKLIEDIVRCCRDETCELIKAYEDLDVLVVDNGFCLNNKPQTRREFLEIANRIINKGGSVIFITDNMEMFSDHSDYSRYLGEGAETCLTVDMPYPPLELKEAFINEYSKKINNMLTSDLVKKIANEEKTISMIKGRLISYFFKEKQT